MQRFLLAARAALAPLFVLLLLAGAAHAQNFTATGPLQTARREQTATLLGNGQVLIVGGLDAANNPLASAEIYDPAKGTFAATGSLVTARYAHTATPLAGGRVLIAGGYGASGGAPASALSKCEVYDSNTGTFAVTGDLVTSRVFHTATAIPAGQVLIAGGQDNNGRPTDKAELYDPTKGVFTATGALPMPLVGHAAVALVSGQVLISGGQDNNGNITTTAELYNPTNGIFTVTGALPAGRVGHTATRLADGQVLIAGGQDNTGGNPTSALLYDPITAAFKATAKLNTARHYHTATLLQNGKVLIVGGRNSTSELDSAELYDSASPATFTATGSLLTARDFHTATLLNNGQVLVAGGGGGLSATTLSKNELYTPAGGAAPTPAPTLSPSAIISTIAGNGTAGFSGDGGAATSAALQDPQGVAVDSAGNVYFGDTTNQRVRKVTPDGIISTVAGNGIRGYSGDGGAATSAQLDYPFGVAVDSAGNLFITSVTAIRRVTPGGIISTVAGNGTLGYSGDGGPATSAQLNSPYGVTVDSAGNLFISDTGNAVVRKVTPGGVISTYAGTGTNGYSGDGGQATQAQLSFPNGLAVDRAGDLFFAESINSIIRKVTPAGIISTVAGNGVNGFNKFAGDGGPATQAPLNNPEGVAVDSAGNLFIPDLNHDRVRRVDGATGLISTVAGTDTQGFSGDSGPATSAQLALPISVALDGAGNLYIADQHNNRIRKVGNAATGPTPTPVPTATPTPGPVATSGALVSQFRFSGPRGLSDQFIELVNITSSPLNVTGWSLSAAPVNAVSTVSIPITGVIPANGHLLLTDSGPAPTPTATPGPTGTPTPTPVPKPTKPVGYSLGVPGDVTYNTDIPTGDTLTLKNADGTVVDQVGSLHAPPNLLDQYAFVRRLDYGYPLDYGDAQYDFNLVDTTSTYSTTDRSGVGYFDVGPQGTGRLGSPNPHNTQSTVQRNRQISNTSYTPPGLRSAARYASKGSEVDPLGRLSIRRTIINRTGASVSKLRFRIVAITAGSSTSSGVADLSAISSGGVKFFDPNNGNRLTRGAYGMTLDAPTTPTEAPLTSGSTGNGGGLNSSWTAPLPGGTLAPGASVNVEFLFGIQAEGNFRVVVDAEVLP